jgi:hypothetical protein
MCRARRARHIKGLSLSRTQVTQVQVEESNQKELEVSDMYDTVRSTGSAALKKQILGVTSVRVKRVSVLSVFTPNGNT